MTINPSTTSHLPGGSLSLNVFENKSALLREILYALATVIHDHFHSNSVIPDNFTGSFTALTTFQLFSLSSKQYEAHYLARLGCVGQSKGKDMKLLFKERGAVPSKVYLYCHLYVDT